MVSLKHALITVVLCVCPDKGASRAALSRWYSGAETAVRSPLWSACAQERASREGRERRH